MSRFIFTHTHEAASDMPAEKFVMEIDDEDCPALSDDLLSFFIRFLLACDYQPGSLARSCARMAEVIEHWKLPSRGTTYVVREGAFEDAEVADEM
jgi:hypothetical protein